MVDSQVLRRLDFPAYCIKVLDNGLLAITGGGGTSKTGVGNSIELGFLDYAFTKEGNDKKELSASGAYEASFRLIHKFETNDAIMKFVSFTCERDNPLHKAQNASKKRNASSSSKPETQSKISPADIYLAGALDHSIEIFQIEPNVEPKDDANVKDKSSAPKYQATATVKKVGVIQLNERGANHENGNRAQPEETIISLQICNMKQSSGKSTGSKGRSSKDSVLLCAGTSRGSILIWSVHFSHNNNNNGNNDTNLSFEKIHEFPQAHGSTEIDGLEVNVIRKNTSQGEVHYEHHLLSIGKDNKCQLWSLDTFSKITELLYTKDKNLRMKHARFSDNFLYTTYVPRIRGGAKDCCSYVQRWSFRETDNRQPVDSPAPKRRSSTSSQTTSVIYRPENVCCIKSTIITSVQTSRDGFFVCIGDCDGKIYLFDSSFTRLINYKQQHSSVITDLVFYHDRPFGSSDSSNFVDLNKLIVSISIDRTLQLYKYINSDISEVSSLLARLQPHIPMKSLPPSVRNLIGSNSAFASWFLSKTLFHLSTVILLLLIFITYFFINVE